MVQKIRPRGVIWVPSSPLMPGHLSDKNDNLAVQYEDVHALSQKVFHLGSNLKKRYLWIISLPIRDSAHGLDMAHFTEDLSQREKLSEIVPPLKGS